MIFVALCALLALGFGALIVLPLVRPGAVPLGADDRAVYAAQLAEIARDVARGVIAPEEAERVRTEVARRLIGAEAQAGVPSGAAVSGGQRPLLAALVLAVMVGGAAGLYYWLGSYGTADLPRAERLAQAEAALGARMSQAEAEAAAAPFQAAPIVPEGDYAQMMEQLRAIVPTRPLETEGWRLLARNEGALGNYAAGARAAEHLVSLIGPEASGDDLTLLLDLHVAAAGGFVSPQAEDEARMLLRTNPDNRAGRYYLGLMYAQFDRPDHAFQLWRPLAESGEDDRYRALARRQIADAAFAAGIDYALPPAPLADARGPSAEDMAAAAQMSGEARQQMIEGMVGGLQVRLGAEGGTADEWAQLIGALGVLGRTDEAESAYAEARAAYEGDDAGLFVLRSAALAAGLTP